jgi:vacuolar protein sorting-associated protein 54
MEHSLNAVTRAELTNHLRNMQHLDFVLLLQKVYKGLLSGVEGLHGQGNVIVEVLESLK